MTLFTDLTAKLTNPRVPIQSKLEEICLFTKRHVKNADRVSLWRFSESFEYIESIIIYDSINNKFCPKVQLEKSDYEAYFDVILRQETLIAHEARIHEATKCFNKNYFEPLNIYSLLDIILHEDFQPAGIICCESVENIAHWTDDEVKLMKKIARASSMYLK